MSEANPPSQPPFSISGAPIDSESQSALLRDRRAGAFVSFEGWVRDFSEGSDVQSLEYEAYAPLAEKEGTRIVQEALAKFDCLAARCVHRTGHLALGDMAVWVGATARHRQAAFEACAYIIDEVKTRVPVWKKEHYTRGDSGWIDEAKKQRERRERGQPAPDRS